MTVDRAGTFNLSGALVVYCNVGVVLCGTLGVPKCSAGVDVTWPWSCW